MMITCVRARARSLPMVEVASVACVRRACRAFTCTSAAFPCWVAPCISSRLRSPSSTCLLSSLWLCSADWSCPCRSWLDWAAEPSWAVRLATYTRRRICHSSMGAHMHEGEMAHKCLLECVYCMQIAVSTRCTGWSEQSQPLSWSCSLIQCCSKCSAMQQPKTACKRKR